MLHQCVRVVEKVRSFTFSVTLMGCSLMCIAAEFAERFGSSYFCSFVLSPHVRNTFLQLRMMVLYFET